MGKTLDIKGLKFDRWTVIDFANKVSSSGSKIWNCICDCGTTSQVSGSSLKAKQSRSCGCLRSETAIKSNSTRKRKLKEDRKHASYMCVLRTYQINAKKAGREFLLLNEEFCNLILGDCFYCGDRPKQIIKLSKSEKLYFYNGIDRLDPDKGYIIDNVVSCCMNCNRAKFKMNREEFVLFINKIYHNLCGK